MYSPKDSDGEGASAMLYEVGNSTRNAIASFNPYGEVLAVEDQRQDGLLATAQVLVYDKSGTRVDVDNLSTGESYETFNLGTPDGSGDIPEGYTVKLNISIGNQSCGTAVGRA
ncbi:hypothetical protein ACWGH4_03795 [Streptomyces sp. NPDC054847]